MDNQNYPINNQLAETPSLNKDFPKPKNNKKLIILGLAIILIIIAVVLYFFVFNKKNSPVEFADRPLQNLQGLDNKTSYNGQCFDSYLITVAGSNNSLPYYSISIGLKSNPASDADLIQKLQEANCQKESQEILSIIIDKLALKNLIQETAITSYVSQDGQRFILT